jgi:hypothetical protein
MKHLFLYLITFIGLQQGIAQTFSVSGRVIEQGKNVGVPFGNIILLTVIDSAQVSGAVSDGFGHFEFSGIPEGNYLLKIQSLGYRNLYRNIQINSDLDLGNIFVIQHITLLTEVIVEEMRSTGTQQGDTSIFNADAFKTLKDASAQALLEKLPGIIAQDGILFAQGEIIAQILVDGEPYFGTDVKTALQNIPAEVIQRIEIFDRKSEKSQLSGFDDGERLKTINIITKPDRRKGEFGKTMAAYGSDERYLVGASINIFNEDRRITFTGLSNNINVLSYSSDANIQDLSYPQEGIIETNILGLNYSDSWGKKIKVSGSYVFSRLENYGILDRFKDFVTTTDESVQLYTERSEDRRISHQHKADLRVEFNPDEKNRILYIPFFSARSENEISGFFGQTEDGFNLINSVENSKKGFYQKYDIINQLLYSHKFDKKGRTFTLSSNFSNVWNKDEADRVAENIFFEENSQISEILTQQLTNTGNGKSWQSRLTYTEPVGKNGQIELEYQIGSRENDSDILTFNVEDGDFNMGILSLDTTLSNAFETNYLIQEAEMGYQLISKKMKIQAELGIQDARLNNIQNFPNPLSMERKFQNFLPVFRLEYKFSPNSNIQIDYDSYTILPQIAQLQPIIDNSNPIQLRTGNMDLDQSYGNQIRLRFRGNNPNSDKNWFVFAQSRSINNFIANSIFIASERTEIQEGVFLESGSQLNKPINLDDYKNLMSWFSYAMPLNFIKSNLNIFGGIGYTQRPSQINDELGSNNSRDMNAGISLSSNISDKVDFNIWSRTAFFEVKNTLNPNIDDNFFQSRFRINFNWIIWKGIIYRLDLNHQVNSGLSEGFDTNFSLINMSLGKKILKNQRGEISIMVYDVLGQNANVRRNITETYIEDIQTNVLQQYLMLSFTYNLRRFSKGMDENTYYEMYQEY